MSERLTFDSEVLAGPIECEDLKILRNYITRGRNRILPNADGTRALRRHRHELTDVLTWFVRGTPDPTGAPQEPQAGIVANLEFYRALFTSGGDAVSEHDIELELGDFTFEGTMQIEEYAQVTTGPMTATILTRFTIPSGELAQTGS